MHLTKDHALAIVKKLRAHKRTDMKGSGHDRYGVYHKGRLVTTIGINRSPRGDRGYGHIPTQVFLTQSQSLDLALCPLTYDEWLDILRQKGRLTD
jgi:hypothetical protein